MKNNRPNNDIYTILSGASQSRLSRSATLMSQLTGYFDKPIKSGGVSFIAIKMIKKPASRVINHSRGNHN